MNTPSYRIASTLFFLLVLPVSGFTDLPADSAENNREFVAAFAPSNLTLDPLHSYKTQELQVATAIYEGLVSYHPETLRPLPAAAWRWDISDDGLVYRFHLRKTARYNNGDPVTAQDFRDSWMRILHPHAHGEYSFLFDVIKGASEYRKGIYTDPSTVGIRAVSEYLLEVELRKPASHFLSMLCHISFMPVHPQYHVVTAWDKNVPITGNGPFTLTTYTPGYMILTKNEYYWDSANVELDTIRIRFINDVTQITLGINDGVIHWAENGDVDLLEQPDALQFHPLFGTSYLYFLTDTSPWNDPNVRKGMALLIPWDEIRADSSVFGTDKLVPSLSFYPNLDGIKYRDQDEGLSLLDAAGYPDGQGLPEVFIKVPRNSSAGIAAQLIATIWEEVLSISVTVTTYNYGDYLDELKKDDYTIASATWIGDFADPLTFLQIWTSESNLNDARYKDPVFDEIIEEAMSKIDQSRYSQLAEAEKLLLENAVVIPLSHPPAFNLINLNRIDGWHPNPLDIHPFKHIAFKQFKIPPNVAYLQ